MADNAASHSAASPGNVARQVALDGCMSPIVGRTPMHDHDATEFILHEH